MADRKLAPGSVPPEHRNRLISQLHVEFLGGFGTVVHTGNPQLDAEREGKKKNHCIIRTVFRDHAQSDIKGAQIRMDTVDKDIDSNVAQYHGSNASDEVQEATLDGEMWVKLILYKDKSRSAIALFQFPIIGDVTLGQLIRVALDPEKRMDKFRFAVINGAYNGCRDWT